MSQTTIFPISIFSNQPPQSVTGVVSLVGLQLAAGVFGLGFTAPDSILRPAGLSLIGASIWTLGQTCSRVIPSILLSNLIGGITGAWLTQFIVSGLILRENFDDDGLAKTKTEAQGPKEAAPSEKEKVKGGFMRRVWFGLTTLSSQRRIGTPQQAKNIPPFKTSDPTYTPSRGAFLLRTLIKAVSSYLLLDLMTFREWGDPSQNHLLFAADKVPFFSRFGSITGGELGLRASISIGHWIGSYLLLQLFHSTLAFGTVLVGFYEPRGWPPLFGSFSDIWSIRQFWGYDDFRFMTASSFHPFPAHFYPQYRIAD
ncbi:uncharacterized protein BP5553_07916 [Venustampulla echinocandica]|uniref:Wax synthase domain-containing protein n=1 Tax=Venustampulla echinocandica TaxID=2656787 RepID=A0A370THX3_9HELO|nr:uncharacterized protein BP5553_07916 [Venustampulla echinocandica]RDL34788.1 hypothetical protein BP5553_07916 [Venustampulla echinocandica]